MREKIKNWWKRYFINQYAIKRTGIVCWFIYCYGKKRVRKVNGYSETLTKWEDKQKPQFDNGYATAKALRGLVAHYYLKRLRKKYSKNYTFELVKKEELSLLEDSTGICAN